jgi:transposase
MVDDLARLGALGTQVLAAWNAKEDLRDVLALARTHPERTVIAPRLWCFYDRCAHSGIDELERLARTVEIWWPNIEAFLRTGITNAGSEGTNRVIKTVARDAYGFRNPHNQRLRTRCATTRRGRGCLSPG